MNFNIPNKINKKKYFIVTNHFNHVDNELEIKYKIYLYYLEDYLCKVIVRRIDENDGWDNDIKIILYDEININSEILSLGSNSSCTKEMDISTTIKLNKNILNYVDKNKIIIINESNTLSNYNDFLNYSNILDNNINYNILFFNVSEQRKFIKNSCNNYYDLFNSIKDTNIRNMIFICNYLYIHGGYYISLNINLLSKISDIIGSHMNNIYLLNKNNIILDILFSSKNNNEILHYLDNLLLLKNKFKINNHLRSYKKIKNNYELNTTYDIDFKNLFYKNYYIINKYFFIIDSRHYSYKLEYLKMGYYLLKNENNIHNKNIVHDENKDDTVNFSFNIVNMLNKFYEEENSNKKDFEMESLSDISDISDNHLLNDEDHSEEEIIQDIDKEKEKQIDNDENIQIEDNLEIIYINNETNDKKIIKINHEYSKYYFTFKIEE
jgi:hypothetical protein